MSYWGYIFIWGYDGLIIGWFGIKDGLINTPKLSVIFWRRFLMSIDKMIMVWYNTKVVGHKKVIPTRRTNLCAF
jgi:hypothetical protein